MEPAPKQCGGKNQFTKCFFSKKRAQLVVKVSDREEDGEMPFFVDAVKGDHSVSMDEWISCFDVNGTDISLKLDTGMQLNILPMKDYNRLINKPKRQCGSGWQNVPENGSG